MVSSLERELTAPFGEQTENADEWSYQKGLEGGWIPRNPDNKLYPNQCS